MLASLAVDCGVMVLPVLASRYNLGPSSLHELQSVESQWRCKSLVLIISPLTLQILNFFALLSNVTHPFLFLEATQCQVQKPRELFCPEYVSHVRIMRLSC